MAILFKYALYTKFEIYLQRDLGKINYAEGKIEELQDSKRQLTADFRRVRDRVGHFEAR